MQRRIAALIILAFTAAPVAAGHVYYLDFYETALIKLLPRPPARGSDAAKADLAAVLAAQKARTPAQIVDAKADQRRSVFRFAEVLGPGFTKDNLPFAAKFFKHVARDDKRLMEPVKTFYNRRRPFVVDTAISTVTRIPNGPSYPSDHAVFASVMETLLVDMVPEKTKAIEDRARQYAHYRVIAGAHFPTDIQAGFLAGQAIAKRMMEDKIFQRDFNRAKLEVRTALGMT